MIPWVLAIDFGTSNTVSAARRSGARAEMLEIDGERRTPSIVFVAADGQLAVGRAAEALANSAPNRLVRSPKSRLGDPTPSVIGGRPWAAVDLVAAILSHVYAEAVRAVGSAPEAVRITHPATWSGPRREQLAAAALLAGIDEPVLLPEPVAAAIAYAEDAAVPSGAFVAVYDLGGGTFDTAVLRANDDGFTLYGRPSGDPRLGGELFDELLFNHLGAALAPDDWDALLGDDDPLWQRAAAALRTEAHRVKELLSAHPVADATIALPDGLSTVRVTRDELDMLMRPYIAESIDVLRRCVEDSGIEIAQLHAIFLVGGASRSPLARQMLADAFATTTLSRIGDPKAAVALGATHASAARAQSAPRGARALDDAATVITIPPTISASRTVIEPAATVLDAMPPGPDRQQVRTWRRPSTVVAAALAAVALIAVIVVAAHSGGGGGGTATTVTLADDTATTTRVGTSTTASPVTTIATTTTLAPAITVAPVLPAVTAPPVTAPPATAPPATVAVAPAPAPTVAINGPSVVVAGVATRFAVTSANAVSGVWSESCIGATDPNWSPGDSFEATWTASANCSLSLTVANSAGRKATSTVSYFVTPQRPSAAIHGPTTIQRGVATSWTVTSSNADRGTWSLTGPVQLGNAAWVPDDGFRGTWNDPGTITLTLTLCNSYWCSSSAGAGGPSTVVSITFTVI